MEPNTNISNDDDRPDDHHSVRESTGPLNIPEDTMDGRGGESEEDSR